MRCLQLQTLWRTPTCSCRLRGGGGAPELADRRDGDPARHADHRHRKPRAHLVSAPPRHSRHTAVTAEPAPPGMRSASVCVCVGVRVCASAWVCVCLCVCACARGMMGLRTRASPAA